MSNEIRFLLITVGSILIGAAVILYYRMDEHFKVKPLHKLYTLMVYYYLKLCVMSVKGVDGLKRAVWAGENYQPDESHMLRLRQKEEQLYRMKHQLKNSSASYQNRHHYNMRRMK